MEVRHYRIGGCANCDSPEITLQTPLFCSQQCRKAAELVRYVRGCRRDGRDQLADVQEAMRMRLAMVLGGGYPERQRAFGRRRELRCSDGPGDAVSSAAGCWISIRAAEIRMPSPRSSMCTVIQMSSTI